MSDENEIDILELMDVGKLLVNKFSSLVKSIEQAKVEFQKFSHTREESVIAATNDINTNPDMTGDTKNLDQKTNSSASTFVDLELNSKGQYQVKPKRLSKKKSFKI